MTNAFTRNDTSVLGIWWWTIDKYMLVIIGLLFLVGSVLILAAGPPAAYRIGADSFYFVRKQFLFIPLCFFHYFYLCILKTYLAQENLSYFSWFYYIFDNTNNFIWLRE